MNGPLEDHRRNQGKRQSSQLEKRGREGERERGREGGEPSYVSLTV